MEPIPPQEVSEVQFDETVDVVVVGLGVAGACAGIAHASAAAISNIETAMPLACTGRL